MSTPRVNRETCVLKTNCLESSFNHYDFDLPSCSILKTMPACSRQYCQSHVYCNIFSPYIVRLAYVWVTILFCLDSHKNNILQGVEIRLEKTVPRTCSFAATWNPFYVHELSVERRPSTLQQFNPPLTAVFFFVHLYGVDTCVLVVRRRNIAMVLSRANHITR